MHDAVQTAAADDYNQRNHSEPMITTYRKLFTLNVAQGNYSDWCRDLNFIVPADTACLLRAGKLIAKALDGKLNVLYEADDGGVALVPMAGARLRFGMKLQNPLFSNVTKSGGPTTLFRNTMAEGNLDPALDVVMTGRILSHEITETIRPVTIAVNDSSGFLLQKETITADNDSSTIFCDLSRQAVGAYCVMENYPAETKNITYYYDVDLSQADVFGVVEIEINSDFYYSRPSFSISKTCWKKRAQNSGMIPEWRGRNERFTPVSFLQGIS